MGLSYWPRLSTSSLWKKKKEEEKINENIKNKENIYTEKERKREI